MIRSPNCRWIRCKSWVGGHSRALVGWSYCYILLGAYELTGEQRYLAEAQTAMDALMTTMSYTESNSFYTATYSDPMEMPVMELMGNSYGAVAAAKLHRLTSDPKYLTYQRDFLNVLLRMTTWFEDQTDARSRDVRSLGLFYPFVAAPTPTAWETAEANLCLAWLLKNDRTNSRAPLLARLSNLNRINAFYFYPATFTPEIRSINPGLRTDVGQYFPTENMYTLEFPSGSGGSPSQTAIYMTGLGMWNSWLYEALAAATDRNILVLNLASLEEYEQSLRSAAGASSWFAIPPVSSVSTTITNQALETGTYQVTVTDPSGARVLDYEPNPVAVAGRLPNDLEFAAGGLFGIENMRTRPASWLTSRAIVRPGGSCRMLTNCSRRKRVTGASAQTCCNSRALFGSAYQAYQSSNYPAGFRAGESNRNQLVCCGHRP